MAEWTDKLFGLGDNKGAYEKATGRDFWGFTRGQDFRDSQRAGREATRMTPNAQRDGWLNQMFGGRVNPQAALERRAFHDYNSAVQSGGESLRMNPQEIAQAAAQASQAQAAQQASIAATLGQQQLAASGQNAGQFETAQQQLTDAGNESFNQAYSEIQKSDAELAFDKWANLQQGAWQAAMSQSARREREAQNIMKWMSFVLKAAPEVIVGVTKALGGDPSGAANIAEGIGGGAEAFGDAGGAADVAGAVSGG